MARRREHFPVVPPRAFDRPGVLDVNQQDYASQQAKALGIQVAVPGKLEPGLSVGLQLDDYTLPEFWWLRRGLRGYAGDARNATAGAFGFFSITCLAGSMLVVEKIILSSPLAAQYFSYGVQAAQPAAAASTPGQPIDTRSLGQAGSARWVLSANAVVVGPTVATRVWVPAQTVVTIDQPGIVLTNGNWFSVIATTVNVEIAVTVIYRERRLLETES